jgi:uncharacterized lipoprotein YbaY
MEADKALFTCGFSHRPAITTQQAYRQRIALPRSAAMTTVSIK